MDETLQSTPLQALHTAYAAKMGSYDGYALPDHYGSGAEAEHLHARQKAGLFDISHLGQVRIRPKEGNLAAVASALETLMPMNLLDLEEGRLIYGLLTTDQGGVRDDLVISRQLEDFLLVLNGANKETNADYLENSIGEDCKLVRQFDRAMLSLQGPSAVAALTQLLPQVEAMRHRDSVDMHWEDNSTITVSRFGYTGMDGFDICLPADHAEQFAKRLLEHPDVELAGMEARHSLRLEAGLCLYGVDLDKTTSPVEASLVASMQACRRPGGERAGGYPGADVIAGQLEHGIYRQRVGLQPEGDELLAAGVELFTDEAGEEKIGRITSACFSPSLKKSIAMGYVVPNSAKDEEHIFAALEGGRKIPVMVMPLPFIAPTVVE